jgi:hypothetical protein
MPEKVIRQIRKFMLNGKKNATSAKGHTKDGLPVRLLTT